jgi:lysozyme
MTIPGHDVSYYQGVIDFAKMKAAGAEFVFIKSTQGNYFDSKFKTNHALSEGKIPRGPYHFYDWTFSLQANIDACVNATNNYPMELPPVLDYESKVGVPTRATAVSYCLTFLNQVQDRTGKTPLLYTSPGFWASYGADNSAFTEFPLWVANYLVSSPTVPKPWTSWLFWQYSSKGDGHKYGASSAAIDMDLGNFATVDEFKIWAGIMPPPPPAPTLEERVTQLETNSLTTEARLQALEAALHIVYMPQIGKG